MTTYRTVKSRNYFHASNEVFQNQNLSWEARGVMGYLLSKPDGWECRNYDLINNGPAGEHKLARVLKELQDAGYMKRIRVRKEDGTFTYRTLVFESLNLKTVPRLSVDGSSVDGSSVDGKPPHIEITESEITESEITESYAPAEKKFSDPLTDIVSQHLTGTTSEATAPVPQDQWLSYGNEREQLVANLYGRPLNHVERDTIAALGIETAEAINHWNQAIESAVANTKDGQPQLQWIIDLYKFIEVGVANPVEAYWEWKKRGGPNWNTLAKRKPNDQGYWTAKPLPEDITTLFGD